MLLGLFLNFFTHLVPVLSEILLNCEVVVKTRIEVQRSTIFSHLWLLITWGK